MTPSISIILPCRNSACYLKQTLQSLIKQSYKDFEVVAVDDHSSDATREILESADSRIRMRIVVPPTPLLSAAASRNIGYHHAAGRWIKFLDSDDVISSDLLSAQLEAVAHKPRNQVAAASWSRFKITPGERPNEQVESGKILAPLEWILRSMEAGHSMMQCGMFLLPRKLIEDAGVWRPEAAPTDDFEYFIRTFLQADSIIPSRGTLYYRSGLKDSLSKQMDRVHAENATARLIEAVANLCSYDDSSRVRRLSAKTLMDWACRFYPDNQDSAVRLENIAQSMWPMRYQLEGGWHVKLVSNLVGWKMARRIQKRLNT